jgi:hypothetical protein
LEKNSGSIEDMRCPFKREKLSNSGNYSRNDLQISILGYQNRMDAIFVSIGIPHGTILCPELRIQDCVGPSKNNDGKCGEEYQTMQPPIKLIFAGG